MNRIVCRFGLALALLVFCAAAKPAAQAKERMRAKSTTIQTIDELWAGFDPRRDPLEIEIVKSWDENDIHIDQLYFTGETFEGEKTRIYAIRGAPKTGKHLPGILHVHGGGQTANVEWVRFWAKRGYVCVSFDFCGDTNVPTLGPEYRREQYTRWGRVPANMMKDDISRLEPTPKYNGWYHWCLTARRALTLLERDPQVDPKRLGTHGTSAGGYLLWMLAGMDKRLKAAVPIYGTGWGTYKLPLQIPEERWSNSLDMRRRLVEPEAYAVRITCPMLFLSASNDGAFNMDMSYLLMDRVPAAIRRQTFTARYNHHIEPPEARSLVLWMDWHLKGIGGPWPKTPEMEITARNGVPDVRVTPDVPAHVQQVDIYYCLNNPIPTSRHWRSVHDVHREGDVYAGMAPFVQPEDVLYVFANVTYASGVKLSSRLLRMPAKELPGVQPTLQRETLISTMDDTEDWYYVPAYTDPYRDFSYFKPWKGPNGEKGFTLNMEDFTPSVRLDEKTRKFEFATHKLGDPQWQGTGHKTLRIDCYGPSIPDTLQIKVVLHTYLPDMTEYIFQPTLPAHGEGWVTFSCDLSQFKDKNGHALSAWDGVDWLTLMGTCPLDRPPVFKNLRWQD